MDFSTDMLPAGAARWTRARRVERSHLLEGPGALEAPGRLTLEVPRCEPRLSSLGERHDSIVIKQGWRLW
jgi:hypothetical protein